MPSTKQISGYLFNIAQRFDGSCEHIRYLLISSGEEKFVANLITGEISPQQFSIPRNQNVVSMAQSILNGFIRPILGEKIASAELQLSMSGGESITEVLLQDKEGNTWQKRLVVANPLIHP